MNKYYEELPSLKLNYEITQKRLEPGSLTVEYKIFKHCESQISGDFLIIYQDGLKSVIPLIQVESIEYPYEES